MQRARKFRDPNRDHARGRIWRVKARGRPLVVPPQIAGTPTPAVLDALTLPEDRTRGRARAELRARPAAEVIPALEAWIASRDPRSAEYAHDLLEALWVYQGQDVVNEPLLDRLLASAEPRARAAATRVLSFWRERAGDVYGRLRRLVADEHPRVRLEAVRALSFFHDAEALHIAIESLVLPQDDSLAYVFRETVQTLSRRLPPVRAGGVSDSARPVVALLESGRLPEARVGDAVTLLLGRGGPAELAWLFAECLEPKKLPASQRTAIAVGLAQAAVERGIRPDGDRAGLRELLAADGTVLQVPAIRLAAAWRDADAVAELTRIAATGGGDAQWEAIAALGVLGTPAARAARCTFRPAFT